MISKIRVILLVLLGLFLSFLIYGSKYLNFIIFDFFIYGIVIIFITILIWSVYRDVFSHKSLQGIRQFVSLIVGVVFIMIILILKINNHWLLHKETSLRVYYDGDFNGTSIDFKTDGTFVVNDFALGLDSYTYGSYQIADSCIVLKSQEKSRNPLLKTNYVIKKNEQGDDYLYPLNDNGSINMDTYLIYKVVVDNRNKKEGRSND